MTKRTSSSHKTVGAISGHFPSAAQRKLNAKIASLSIGAQIERQVALAEMGPAVVFTGQSPAQIAWDARIAAEALAAKGGK